MKKAFLLLMVFAALVCSATVGIAREFHVSVSGDDANDGSAAKPFKTITAAARAAFPGDSITVHAGVYRERVSPPRGGESDAKRIVYQAAPGENVEIKGSEVIKNWQKVQGNTWKVVIPNSFFGDYNPFGDEIRGDWFEPKNRKHHTGAVYLNGDWLIETAGLDEVLDTTGAPPAWLTQHFIKVAWLQTGADARIPAASAAARNGAYDVPCDEAANCIGFSRNGQWVKFEKVNFKQNTSRLELRASTITGGGVIEVRTDAPDGKLLGSFAVPNTGGMWFTLKNKIKPVSGPATLFLVLRNIAPETARDDVQLWYAEVDKENTTIWARFKDADPNEQTVDINVRKAVFYPEKTGINYITVRGFTMRDAATQWAPPTAEQIAIIGPNWSKGWIIENNTISHSVCACVSLGKYGDEFDNTSANSAEGYIKTIERAAQRGWSKENIGHHIVRNNTISYCEQAGIVGSLGAVFSTISGNTIHDVHVRRFFSGAEMAGIKLHAAIDVTISGNHIYRTCLGTWLDWMAQGTRVTGNLYHDNYSNDLFVEVDHGPFLVDNNIFLSTKTLLSFSQGGAYVHNLIAGDIQNNPHDSRLTPYMKPHSTELAGVHDNPFGDDRFFNNIFVKRASLKPYDGAALPVWMSGNVFLGGATPSARETEPLYKPDFDPALKLVEKDDGYYLEFTFDSAWRRERTSGIVTTSLLGKTAISGAPFEQPDGAPLQVDHDYSGNKRDVSNPTPGPFETPGNGSISIKVWPKSAE